MKLYCEPTIIDHTDCDMYPFAHYIVITYTDHIVGKQTVTDTRVFVICAICDHDADSPKKSCNCEASCHPNQG